ncbi:MAG: UxaA family hydrolase [Hyphomonadaceae bacterium]|nr:UxaA family hydrolase [Hyphomonadaceae bacterium]
MTGARFLQLNPLDDVAIALDDAAAGDAAFGVRAAQAIPQGHKIALRAIAAGAAVRKYGQIIGCARTAIAPGAHVHVHNLAMTDAPRPAEYGADVRAPAAPTGAQFSGFVRPDGRVGTRNVIGVLTTVNCSATVARRVADHFTPERMAAYPHVDGVAAFTHHGGCGVSATGDDAALLNRTLAGYARHPNFAGVVIIGLGCEVNQIERLFDEAGLAPGPMLQPIAIQEAGGTLKAIERGAAIVREMAQEADKARRQMVSAAHLTVGLQCGGSDAWSGVTANPSLGAAVDLLVAEGGAAILSETPEIYGAEHLLLRRAMSPEVAEKLSARIAWWQAYVARHGADLNNNPSPGNIQGGLTTILEKSLGAVAKSGGAALSDVLLYAEPLRRNGFVFMDSPGYDPCSATGQIASGATLIAFTTGRGSVFGSKPAPCLKLASNARLAMHMDDDIDIDCAPVLSGASLESMGELIFARMLEVASGARTKSEALGVGDHEFVPWRLGAWL